MGEVIPFPSARSAPRLAAEPHSEPKPGSQSAPRPESVSQPESAPQPEPAPQPRQGSTRPEPLWRAAVGEELRAARADRGERIADVAERAGMSPQYLSEIERGRKDPSSEMLAAVAGALGLTARELANRVARRYDVMPVTLSLGSGLSLPTSPPAGPLCLAA